MVLWAFSAPSCGRGTKPTPPAPPQAPPSQTGPIQTVTGVERIAWDQQLVPDTSVDAYDFAAYVSGERRLLESVRCGNEPGAAALTCSAALPRLQPGRNTLELVAVLDGTESERSEQIVVQLAAGARRPVGSESTAMAGLVAETIGPALEFPTDLAMLPDGRLLVAERRGLVRVVGAAASAAPIALRLEDIADSPGFGLLAIAAHPDFDRNRFVYLGYTAKRRDGGATYRVIRARERNHQLAELATVHESIPARAPAWMSMRFGPDGKLYVGVPACRDCGSAYAGVVLRLNDDGSTPHDGASTSPVFMRGLTLPVGLSWVGDQLWVADWRPQRTAVVIAARGGEYAFGTTESGAIVTRVGAGPPAVLLTRPRATGLHSYQLRADNSAIEGVVAWFDERTTVHAAIYAADGAMYLCVSDHPDGAARLMRVTGWP